MRSGWRLHGEVLYVAAAEHHAHIVIPLVGGDARHVGHRQRLPADHGALHRGGAAPGGEDLQDAEGAAGRRGRELILRNLDNPVSASDRNAGERRGVLGIEPALGGGEMSRVGRSGRANNESRRGERRGSETDGTFGENYHGGGVSFGCTVLSQNASFL